MGRDRPALSRRSARSVAVTAGGLVVAAYLVALVFWPIAAVLWRSLGGVGPGRMAEIVSRSAVWSVAWFTVWQAAASAAVTLAVGLPLARVLARYRFRGKTALRAFVVVPFVLPTLVVASAFDAVLEMVDGWLPWVGSAGRGSLTAVLGAHVFFNLAVVVRIVGGRWATVGRSQAEAAAVLGASPLRAWRTVTLPQLRPVLVGSFLLIFLFSFTSFGVIRVLGGLRMATVETEIYRYAVARQQFDVAAVLAVLQLAVVGTLSVAAARLQRSQSGVDDERSTDDDLLAVDRPSRRLTLLAVVLSVALIQGVPIGVMVERSLRVGDGYGFDHYRALSERMSLLPTTALGAIANSLVFAAIAAAVAAAVGMLAVAAIVRSGVVGRSLEALTFVPLGVSAVTLGFGYLVGFAVFDLRSSWWLLPLAHSVVGLPFVLSSMVPAVRSIDPALREAAATLGASPAAVIRTVDWPLTRRALATGVGFAAAVSLGEFGATSFLARGDATFTAPLAIFRLLGTPGDAIRGQAMALSVVVGVLVAAVALAIEVRRDEGVSLL